MLLANKCDLLGQQVAPDEALDQLKKGSVRSGAGQHSQRPG